MAGMTATKFDLMEALGNRTPGGVPVAPHWYGAYKAELAGDASLDPWTLYGEDHARLDRAFVESIDPDWLQCTIPAPLRVPERMQGKELERIRRAIGARQSFSAIHDYIAITTFSDEELAASRQFEHVGILVREYGHRRLVVPNEGSPVCGIFDPDGTPGFMTGFEGMIETPEFMAYLFERTYRQHLGRVLCAAKRSGFRAYLGSETWCGADLMSPASYREIVHPAQRLFYLGLAREGILPLAYFTGDVRPILGDIATLGIAGLLVEESKKGFTLDPVVIRQALDPSIVLFGNLDSVGILRFGSTHDVERATVRQLDAAELGSFVMANGSPIAPETPRENILAMTRTVRAGA
jgi:hypothetical protein